jgi:hypothetical protein
MTYSTLNFYKNIKNKCKQWYECVRRFSKKKCVETLKSICEKKCGSSKSWNLVNWLHTID